MLFMELHSVLCWDTVCYTTKTELHVILFFPTCYLSLWNTHITLPWFSLISFEDTTGLLYTRRLLTLIFIDFLKLIVIENEFNVA